MTRILCTFPGKYGDLLWALPSVRAISEAVGGPVDLVIAGAYQGLLPLLELQPYLGKVTALPAWEVQDTAPMTPRTPPLDAQEYDLVLHLGYRGWPQHPLPIETHDCACSQWPTGYPDLPALDLTRPWITPPAWAANLKQQAVAVGFTEEYFELKVGVYQLIQAYPDADQRVNLSVGPRWRGEYCTSTSSGMSWDTAAAWLSRSAVFLGCNSALHVLACAIGTPVVIMEPNPQRHHEIFWPYGKSGPQVTQVIGGDGQWTFDARHVWETVQVVGKRRALEGLPSETSA